MGNHRFRREDADTRIGRYLCLILRHHPEKAGITLDEHGWADVEELIAGVSRRWPMDRAKLEEKMKELPADTQIEESRIAAEVILFADKICTDEEVVRLKSHISHMRNTLDEKDEIGRKLDFIAQEMNREANTILSKANDIEISDYAISLKTEIEKIREQIQNIE